MRTPPELPPLKSVLYISYDGMTDPLGQSQVIPYMAGLARKGHRITILSCEKEDNFRELEGRCRQVFDACGIEWHHVSYTKRPPILSTQYDLSGMRRLGNRLASERDFDIVHCRTVVSMLVGSVIARQSRSRLVFDTRSFWTDERVDGGLWDLRNPIYRGLYAWFKRKEHQFYQEADLVVTLTHRARTHIERTTDTTSPIHVIPCCVDMARFSPSAVDPRQASLHANTLGLGESQFVLTYLGSLGTRYMLSEMLEFFGAVRARIPDAVFLFITRDDQGPIRAAAGALGIQPEALRFVPAAYDDVPTLLSLADASVFFIEIGSSGMAVSPTKQAELLSMGKRVICNAGIGDCDEIVGDTQAGIILTEFTPSGYAAAADRLLKPALPPEEIRAVAAGRLNLREGIGSYHSAWESLESDP